MSDPLLQCDSPITFDGFDILAFVSHKFKLLIKGSLIIRDKPVLNRTIKSFLLDLFDKVFNVYKKYNHISIFQKERKTLWNDQNDVDWMDQLFSSKCRFWECSYCKSAKTELLHWYFLEIINIDEKKLQKN